MIKNEICNKKKFSKRKVYYRIIILPLHLKRHDTRSDRNEPSIGVGIFLVNIETQKVLIGKRKEGLFGLPGGWLEISEEWGECASRELWEETNILKQPYTFSHIHTLNCRQLDKNSHSISCVMYNELERHEMDKLRNREPHKCFGWQWVTIKTLRNNKDRLFYALKVFLNKFSNINKVSDIKDMRKVFLVKNTL